MNLSNTLARRSSLFYICFCFAFIFLVPTSSCSGDVEFQEKNVVNDVTQLNPIKVANIVEPTTTNQIVQVVKTHKGSISIGGGRFSMGGQTATANALQIDMRKYNQVLHFSKAKKEITVQAGMRWRELITYIDSANLSVKIMQTYANFTIGGSLSVNVHGRYIGQGPIILSVKRIKMVMASGALVTASPYQNSDLFYAAIGGYGGLGIIAEVTLDLTDNVKVERIYQTMPIANYLRFFKDSIKNDKDVVFHNADIYPNEYQRVRAVSYVKTQKELTIQERLKPNDENLAFNQAAVKVVAGSSFGKWLRKSVLEPLHYQKEVVEWRNYEATYDVRELEPASRKKSTFVLQEYFVPVDQFDLFYPKLTDILKKHKVNVLNISIRHAKKDPGSLMAWAKTEVFAFVIYYQQGTTPADAAKVKRWTNELINAAIKQKGSYYLPYQILATPEQFKMAYPNWELFFKTKKKYDPDYRFRNKLFDAYLSKTLFEQLELPRAKE